jgi:hypothetical protein
MKPISWIGILLIVLGGLALAYQGFTYTHQEKVLDLGPIHATAEKQDRFHPFSAGWHWSEELPCLSWEAGKHLSSNLR